MTNSEFTYKPTTALYKIKNLLKNKQKTFVIQGGQGAGKTISILMILIDFAYRNDKKEVSIISDELAKMKRTVVNDFLKIMKDWNLYNSVGTWNKSESKYYFDNGSFIEFLGLDLHDVGKGMRRDIVYTNEANKVKQEAYRQVASRASISIIDFNPDGFFWGTDLINTENFIQLTFKDNEHLGKGEIDSILKYYEDGYYENGTIKNEYWANVWRVYGLGEVGSVASRIFTHFKQNTFKEFINLNLPEFYGIDWGKNHGFGIIHCKYDQYTNTLYTHELNSKSENQLRQDLNEEQRKLLNDENGGIIVYTLTRLGVPKDAKIICDSARPDNIFMLQDFGWYSAIGIDKPKGSVMTGIELVQSTNIVYTNESKGIDNDFKNYQYATDRLGVVDDEVIKLNDDCFTAETLITTDKGLVKIIDVKIGDKVLTSNGYREVLHKFNNGKKIIKEYSLLFDTFSVSLNVTENHLIKTSEKWTKISKLESGMMVYHTKHSTEESINFTTEEDTLCNTNTICTTKYGSLQMEQEKKDFISTTSMVTRGITLLKTLKKSKERNTLRNTLKNVLITIQNGLQSFTKLELKRPKNGINHQRELQSIDNKQLIADLAQKLTEKKNALCVSQNLKQEQNTHTKYVQTNANQSNVEIVESIMNKESAKYANQSLPLTNIQKLKLVGVEVKNERYEETYDLMVEETHEFFANGILVHNCVDPIRYVRRHIRNIGLG